MATMRNVTVHPTNQRVNNLRLSSQLCVLRFSKQGG